jgi:hypothetical protein
MRHALAVAGLELREWRALPLLALAAGFLLLAVQWTGVPVDLKSLAVELPTLGWAFTALTAGASVFTRDVREGRAAFLCARPVALVWIWAGKLLAATVVAGTVWALAALPMSLWTDSSLSGPATMGGLALGTLLLVGLGHWIGLAVLARGWRLVADVLVSTTLLGVIVWLAVRLWVSGAVPWGTRMVAGLCGALLVAAGGVAVVRGRGARAASYAGFTAAHWSGLAALVLAQGANLYLIRSVEPGDLDRIFIQGVSPDGRWLSVFGPASWPPRKDSAILLASVDGRGVVNTGRGSFRESPGADVEFSADGRWSAWPVLQMSATGGSMPAVRVVELRSGAPIRSRPTPVAGGDSDTLAWPLLSPTGRGLLLIFPHGRLEALTRDGLRTLWRLEGVDSAGFLDDERVWIVRRRASGRELATYGLDGGEQRQVVAMGGEGESNLVVSSTGDSALALTKGARGEWVVELCDVIRGGCRVLWAGLDVDKGPGGSSSPDVAEGAFLADGGVVIAGRALGASASGWEVRAFDAGGQPRWKVPIPPSRYGAILIGEPRPGTLFVQLPGYTAPDDPGKPHPLLVIDAASGRVLRAETGLAAHRFFRHWRQPFRRGTAATYFAGFEGPLLRLDPETGRREAVPLG